MPKGIINILNRNQTYRSFTAAIFVVLILQVIVLQSIHQIWGHLDVEHDHDSTELAFHAFEHEHASCNICMFQFQPLELSESVIDIDDLSNGIQILVDFTKTFKHLQNDLQKCLRGPPSLLV